MGRLLAVEHPAEADLVIAVPNTGHSAAQGYSEVSGSRTGTGCTRTSTWAGRSSSRRSRFGSEA